MPDEPAGGTAKDDPANGGDPPIPRTAGGSNVIIDEEVEPEPEVQVREPLALRRPEIWIKARVMARGGRKQGPPTNPADAYARLNKKP